MTFGCCRLSPLMCHEPHPIVNHRTHKPKGILWQTYIIHMCVCFICSPSLLLLWRPLAEVFLSLSLHLFSLSAFPPSKGECMLFFFNSVENKIDNSFYITIKIIGHPIRPIDQASSKNREFHSAEL